MQLACPSFELSNTLGLHSQAERVFEAHHDDEVIEAARWAVDHGLPLVPLGAGSNVVLPPKLNAAVIHCADTSVQVCERSSNDAVLRVGAGKNWHELVNETVESGYFGLENLALIPGNVGAAPVQNIGAYGSELSAFVEQVHGVDLDSMQTRVFTAQECAFSYRGSIFKHRFRDRFVITALTLRLPTEFEPLTAYPSLAAALEHLSGAPTARDVLDAVVAVRTERLPDPLYEPNAGSFFKNPVVGADLVERLRKIHPQIPAHRQSDGRCKLSAAWLIEHSGLRGHQRGGAAVSELHALVLVNRGAATQANVLDLAAHIAATVELRFGVELRVEPRIYTGV
ncbi:MAG: UDP-N-acetylmuramate dehydrogenase [Congregibacter sp.]